MSRGTVKISWDSDEWFIKRETERGLLDGSEYTDYQRTGLVSRGSRVGRIPFSGG
jgi:hypothetical protein